jgi:hypothetical protein
MRHRLFLANMSMLLLLSAACGDRMERPIPGMDDSLHFNRADYKIIRKLPDSVGFRIRSTRLDGEFKDRIILEMVVSKALDGYSFPIVCSGKNNNNGKTVKPIEAIAHDETKAGAMLDKRLKYIIYGAGSVYIRLYLRLPGQDRVLFELPVRWKTKKE